MGERMKRQYSEDVEYNEASAGYTGEEPVKGLYPAKLVRAEDHKGGKVKDVNKTHWVFRIIDGDYEGWQGHYYTDDGNLAERELQVLVACGLSDPDDREFNMTYEDMVRKAKPVRIRTYREKYENEMRGKIGSVLPAGEEASGSRRRRSSDDGDDEPRRSRKKTDDEPF